jgi:HK97 family phage portal protein
MNLLPKLSNPFRWLSQKAATTAVSIQQNQLFTALYKFLGQNMPIWMGDNPESYIKNAYARNDDVFSVINYIVTTAGRVPWKLYKVKADGTMTEIKKHKLLNLIERPNPWQGQSEFIAAELGYKLVTGNTYQYAPKLESGNNAGQTTELYVMPAHLTEIVFGNRYKPYKAFKLIHDYENDIPAANVLHRKEWNPLVESGSDLYGMSRLRAGSRIITQSNDGRTAQTKAFQNQGALGILSQEGSDGVALNTEQASEIEQKYKEKFGGPENYGKIIITSVNLKWQKMGLSPVDLDILETQKWSFHKLCNLYKFPSQILNDKEASTYNNMREAKKAAYEDCILPELYALRDEWNRWLVPAYGEDLYLDIDTSGISVLQDDKKEQVEWLRNCFWMKGIDKQRAMGIEEDPIMDAYFDPNGVPLMFDPEEATADKEEETID